jgi:branched-chain amino acid transport system ATP-binding protein
VLNISSVSKNFGGLRVLVDVSLTVPERGIYGLIGPNGAGKTTVFNVITGLLAPSSGSIEFSGHRLNGLTPHQITRAGVARTFQNIRIFSEMTLLENVLVPMAGRRRYNALEVLLPLLRSRTMDRRERERAEALLARVGLSRKSGFAAGSLSYGEQRRLEIARALATDPKLLLLDEPAAGMNRIEKQQLIEEVLKLAESGISILIVEHDVRFVMRLCKEITVLHFGQIIAHGTPDEIRADANVVEAYLGRDHEE